MRETAVLGILTLHTLDLSADRAIAKTHTNHGLVLLLITAVLNLVIDATLRTTRARKRPTHPPRC